MNLLLHKLTYIFSGNIWLCWISGNLFLKYVLICYITVMHLHITVSLSVTKSAKFQLSNSSKPPFSKSSINRLCTLTKPHICSTN